MGRWKALYLGCILRLKTILPRSVQKLLLRLLIGVVFAIFGLINYFGHVDVNPVTGEKQRLQMTPQQEQVLGLQSREQMAAQHGGLYPDETLQRYIQQVGQGIVQRSAAQKSPYKYEFFLLKDPQVVNAFALPGGQVFMTAALLARLDSEAQIAGVLGHEIGHVVARHGAEHIAKQQLGAAIVQGVGVAASDGYGGGQQAAAMAQAVSQLVSLRYGRADELESDQLGFEFMTQAGYDPRGIAELMKILASLGNGSRQPEILSSHPDPGNRFERLQEMIQAAYPNGLPSNLEDGRERFAQVVRPRLR
jgi:predicted Zn-dependent protease